MDEVGYPRRSTLSGDHEFRPANRQGSRRWRLIDSPEPAPSGSQLSPLPPQSKKHRQGKSTSLFDQIMAIRRAGNSSVSKPAEPKRVVAKRLQRGPQSFVGTSQTSHHSGPSRPHPSRQAGKSQVVDLSQTSVTRYGSRLSNMAVPTPSRGRPTRGGTSTGTCIHPYSVNHPASSQHQSMKPHETRLPKEWNPYYRRMSGTLPGASLEVPATDHDRDDTNRDIGSARPSYTHHGTSSRFKDARELIGRRELSSSIEGTSAYPPSSQPVAAPPRSNFSEETVALPRKRIVSISPNTHMAPPTPAVRSSGSGSRITSLSKAGKRVVALDCEMIGCLEVNTPRALSSAKQILSRKGKKAKRDPMLREISVAARCSIVDYGGAVLYDGYIMPKLKILSLRTKYSGITWKHLRTAVPFDVAQAEIIAVLEGCIVVGHAIRNDTAALNITLPQEMVRDTSTYKPLREMAGLNPGAIPSLKNLANVLLGVTIQKGSHCSLEDARTTLELYKLVEPSWECIS